MSLGYLVYSTNDRWLILWLWVSPIRWTGSSVSTCLTPGVCPKRLYLRVLELYWHHNVLVHWFVKGLDVKLSHRGEEVEQLLSQIKTCVSLNKLFRLYWEIPNLTHQKQRGFSRRIVFLSDHKIHCSLFTQSVERLKYPWTGSLAQWLLLK